MHARVLGATLLCAAAVWAAAAAGGPPAPARPPAEAAEHDFGTKVLLVTARPQPGRDDGTTNIFQQARVRRLGDRYFLVGRWADLDGASAYTGTVIWMALSDVEHIIEFDSVAAVKKAYADRDKGARKKL